MDVYTSILYNTCGRHNEKSEAELDENFVSIVMVILRALERMKNISTVEYEKKIIQIYIYYNIFCTRVKIRQFSLAVREFD